MVRSFLVSFLSVCQNFFSSNYNFVDTIKFGRFSFLLCRGMRLFHFILYTHIQEYTRSNVMTINFQLHIILEILIGHPCRKSKQSFHIYIDGGGKIDKIIANLAECLTERKKREKGEEKWFVQLS